MSDPKTGVYTNRSPSRRGPKPIEIDPKDVEALAEACVSKKHLAEELGISHDALEARLRKDDQFREAWKTGRRNLRRFVAGSLIRHAQKNVIAAITLANQPDIMGFTNPNTRIEGKIEHHLTFSPAEAMWERRLSKQMQSDVLPKAVSHSDTPGVTELSQPDTKDAEVIEIKAE